MEKQQTTINRHVEDDELLELRQQVSSLAGQIEHLHQEMAKQSQMLAELVARLNGTQPAAQVKTESTAVHEKAVGSDVLVIIAAAVSAFLGKKIRIRSARMLLSPYEIVNPWSQQGRVSVQASHMLHHER